jgi:hypothetical protein
MLLSGPATPLDLNELLVSDVEISGCEAIVGGMQQPFAIELGLFGDSRLVDPEAASASRRIRRQRARVVRSRPASSSRRDVIHPSVPAIWVSR